MVKPHSALVLLVFSLLLAGQLHAKTLYVTDRILLGVHTQPNEESPLLDSIPSGSAVEVLAEADAFKQIKLASGKTGWVSSGYLVAEKPGAAKLDELSKKHQLATDKFKTAKEKLTKTDRELQVRIDELSNARTTIRELRKKIKNAKKKSAAQGNPGVKVDPKLAAELAAANQEIENLKQKLAGQAAQQSSSVPQDAQQQSAQLEQFRQQATTLRARIELAMANLQGEVPPDETGKILVPPNVPSWYWALLVTVMILGLIIGIIWMDYRHRLRHGGFRV